MGFVDRVRPHIEAARDEADDLGRLPDHLLDALRDAGAFRIFTPIELQGFEADLPVAMTCFEELGRLDGAVAWNVWNGNLGFSAALLDSEGTGMIWGGGVDPVIANSARVTGAATRAPGGFVLSGRWDIVSAIDSADWVALFGVVMDGAHPQITPSGMPDVRVFYLRRDQITILDTWDVTGMRGTGSKTVIVDAASVSAHLTADPFGTARIDRPLYRIPAFTLASCGSAAIVIGMAQASIDALVELAAGKATDNGATLRHRTHAQHEVAAADAELNAARLLLLSTAADIMLAAVRAQEMTMELRGPFRAAMSHAGRTAHGVVDAMYRLGGSSSLYRKGRLERLFRDTNAATQHALLQPGHFETAGRLMLGLDAGVPVF